MMGLAACVVVEREGLVLAVKRKDGRGWALPGGKVEAGEEIWAAALRELREETGLEGDSRGLKLILDRENPESGWRVVTYVVEAEGEVRPAEGEPEAAFVEWRELIGGAFPVYNRAVFGRLRGSGFKVMEAEGSAFEQIRVYEIGDGLTAEVKLVALAPDSEDLGAGDEGSWPRLWAELYLPVWIPGVLDERLLARTPVIAGERLGKMWGKEGEGRNLPRPPRMRGEEWKGETAERVMEKAEDGIGEWIGSLRESVRIWMKARDRYLASVEGGAGGLQWPKI